MEVNHLCTIKRQHSGTYLPPLPQDPSYWDRFKRKFRTWTMVSRNHPKCIEYFKSATGVKRERKRQVRMKLTHIIHPFSSFRLYYEMYMTLLYSAVLISKCCDYSLVSTLTSSDIVYEATAILCLPDIIVTFLTGYELHDARQVVLNPKQIAWRYIKSMFIVDILSFTPVKLFCCGLDDQKQNVIRVITNIVRMLVIIKIYTLLRYVSNIAEYFDVKTNKVYIILRHITTLIVIVHFVNIVQFHVPQIRAINTETYVARHSWMRKERLEKVKSGSYVKTFFFSSSLLLASSHARTHPDTWDESFLRILTYIFGKFYTIILTVLVLHMMMTSRMLQIKYDQKLDQLEEYMKHKNFPITMRKRLRLYYDYKYKKRFFREQVISSILSDGLKREIKMHVCRKIVSNVTLFAGLSTQVVRDIIEYLHKEVYLPNDTIITAGDPGECMYFLSTGTVAVYTPSGRELCHLQDGAYFGEISLIMKDQFRTASVYAVEICEVYILDRKHFKRYFMGNASLYQELYQKAEDRLEMLMTIEEFYKNKGYSKT